MALANSAAVPAPAAAVGYNTETFGPAVTLGNGWQRWSNAVNATQNGDGTVTITGGGNSYNAQIITAAPNGSGGLTGEAFGGGGYFDATLSFAGNPVMNNGWPSFWANDIENQIQGQTGNGASQWQGQETGYVNSIEADFMEYMTGLGNYGIAMHNWYGQQSAIQSVNTDSSGSPVNLPPGTDTSQPHNYGFLWMPATATTQGYAKWYFDDVQVGNTITWNQYNPATPPPPVNGSSAYSVMDARHLYLILGTGPSNPMTVYNVSVWQNSSAADIGTLQTPPPTGTASSPDGTKITTAAASPIIDKAGNAWSLVQSASSGLQIAVNGTVDPVTANVVLLETLGGNMVQENTSGNWYSEPGPGAGWSQIANPTPTPPASAPSPSPDGTKITSASASPIIDKSRNAWSLVQSASSGLQIAVNGTVDPVTANVVLLETLGGNMVQENASGNWYSEAGPTSSWTQIAAPVPPAPASVTTGSGSDTLVLSISEDAYANGDGTSDAAGDAAFTVSVDGKQLAGTFFTITLHSAGASQNFTFRGDWAPGAHTVAVNFLNDAWRGTASTDRNLYVNDVTYDGTDTKRSGMLANAGAQSFSVTDSTALPVPVIGGGSDTLLLKVSEDAYKGDAQFTVSVDGKQLGGTLTATTLHASGGSQSFAFKGDFGAGAHTVSVNFLNDAYAGTAATDRNLYVNDIVYNGTDRQLAAELTNTGAKTFSVSGGTTPSVSETSDHGSLQKNLSQTGTYTVGGDTFVLTSGNAASVTLGTGASQVTFVGPSSATLTAGSGQAAVTADAGNNKFVAGTGSLDVTGGAGKDAYVFHATGGLLTLEDFSLAKGDTLTVDKTLQGSLHQATDGRGGTMLTFGTDTSHGVDIRGMSLSSSNILWA